MLGLKLHNSAEPISQKRVFHAVKNISTLCKKVYFLNGH